MPVRFSSLAAACCLTFSCRQWRPLSSTKSAQPAPMSRPDPSPAAATVTPATTRRSRRRRVGRRRSDTGPTAHHATAADAPAFPLRLVDGSAVVRPRRLAVVGGDGCRPDCFVERRGFSWPAAVGPEPERRRRPAAGEGRRDALAPRPGPPGWPSSPLVGVVRSLPPAPRNGSTIGTGHHGEWSTHGTPTPMESRSRGGPRWTGQV